MQTVRNIIGPHFNEKAYALASGVVVCGGVYEAARRVLQRNWAVHAALGVAAGCLAGYAVVWMTVHSLQNIKTPYSLNSASLNPGDKKKVQETKELLARHEALLPQLKIPGLIASVEKMLRSGNVHNILVCEEFLKEGSIAGFQVGKGNNWILPQSDGSDGVITINTGNGLVQLKTTNAGCTTLLKKLGVKEDDSRPYAFVNNMMLELENSQVSKIALFNKMKTPIGGVIEIKENRTAVNFVKGLKRMPISPEGYTKGQAQVTNILINTIWQNPEYNAYKDKLEAALRENFAKVLEILAEIAFKGTGHQMSLGDTHIKDILNIAPNDDARLQQLCTGKYAENIKQPHLTVFNLEAVRSLAQENDVKMTSTNGHLVISMNPDTINKLLAKLRDIVANNQPPLPAADKIQKIVVQDGGVDFVLKEPLNDVQKVLFKDGNKPIWREIG